MGSIRAKTKANKVNKHELHQQKQRRTLIYLSSFLIIIMVFSSFGVMLYNTDSNNTDVNQNGFKFKETPSDYYSIWNVTQTPKDKKEFKGTEFMLNPSEYNPYVFNDDFNKTLTLIANTEFIYVINNPAIIDASFIEVFNNETNETNLDLIQGNNFNDSLMTYQYQAFSKSSLIQFLNKITIPLSGVENEFPGITEEVITCNNATESLPVISFISNDTIKEGISLKDNCVLINAKNPYSYIIYSDTLKYSLMYN